MGIRRFHLLSNGLEKRQNTIAPGFSFPKFWFQGLNGFVFPAR
jgi:hypothetical protein